MKIMVLSFSFLALLGACGGGDVVYRLEQSDPARDNVIGITNAGGSTRPYGSISVGAHRSN